ncbi:MAG: hypothetical protein IJ584_13710 [Bacteroidales bacterium]|nr:hypothetical protein [Bacteroidales bacterium]
MNTKEAKIILQCRGNGYSEDEFNEALEIAYSAIDSSLPSFLDSLSEEPVNEDLEEAVEKQIDEALYKWSYDDEDGIEQYVHDAFIAGAKWQYQKDRGEFAKIKAKTWCEGFDAHKEQMLKDAVEGEVCHYGVVHNVSVNAEQFIERLNQFPDGEKVRIIIVKEDKK